MMRTHSDLMFGILVNRVRVKDFQEELHDGDRVVFSFPPVGG